jgi:tripartite-type tricarboxylate transporter receptor subunit TctC
MKYDKGMKLTRRYSLVFAAAIGLSSHFCAPLAFAQDAYPSKPIKLVVPYPPGGANDALGRALAQKLAISLKTSVIIENRPGVGGVLGTAFVAKAPADGYTLLIINTLPHTASGSLYKKAPYDPIGDFAPISLIATTPYVLAVNSQSKFSSLSDLLEQAKHRPGAINYASGGQGGATHLLMELFKSAAKVDLTHIAYKGGGPAITDLLGGQVDVTFENIVAVLPLVTSGKLRPLAISSSKPSKLLSGVPTVAAILKTDFDVLGRFALVAPAGVPQPVLMKLNAAVVAAVQSPDMAHVFAKQGIEPESSTPSQLAAAMKSEMALWAKLIDEKGIRLD